MSPRYARVLSGCYKSQICNSKKKLCFFLRVFRHKRRTVSDNSLGLRPYSPLHWFAYSELTPTHNIICILTVYHFYIHFYYKIIYNQSPILLELFHTGILLLVFYLLLTK